MDNANSSPHKEDKKSRRGFACVGLDQPKFDENVGGVLRAAGIFEVSLVALNGSRLRGGGRGHHARLSPCSCGFRGGCAVGAASGIAWRWRWIFSLMPLLCRSMCIPSGRFIFLAVRIAH